MNNTQVEALRIVNKEIEYVRNMLNEALTERNKFEVHNHELTLVSLRRIHYNILNIKDQD